jgi:hypothetical protein
MHLWLMPNGELLFFFCILVDKNKPFWIEAGFIEDLRKTELKEEVNK